MSKRVDTKNPLLFVSRLDHSLSLSYYTKCSLWAHFAYEKTPAALGRPRLDTRRPATKSLAWKPPAHSCSLAVTISCGKRSMRRFSESWKSRTKRKSRTGYLLCSFFPQFTVCAAAAGATSGRALTAHWHSAQSRPYRRQTPWGFHFQTF